MLLYPAVRVFHFHWMSRIYDSRGNPWLLGQWAVLCTSDWQFMSSYSIYVETTLFTCIIFICMHCLRVNSYLNASSKMHCKLYYIDIYIFCEPKKNSLYRIWSLWTNKVQPTVNRHHRSSINKSGNKIALSCPLCKS